MWFTSFDESVYALSTPSSFWAIITLLGDTITLVVLTAVLLFVLKDKAERLQLLAAGVAAIILVNALKLSFGRPRPDASTLLTPAFPSGHTLGATAVYGMVAYLLWKRGYRWQPLALTIIPVLVGISRVMLQHHWASDVIAGWLLGAIAVFAIAMGTSQLRRSRA